MKSYYNNFLLLPLFLGVSFMGNSCSKLLDEKPDKSTALINNIRDLQALMYAVDFLNNMGFSLADVGSDEYYLSDSEFDNLNEVYRNTYIWNDETVIDAWVQPYRIINRANTVLRELDRLEDGTSEERELLAGQAYFFRAFAYYHLSQVYCKPYGEDTKQDLGVPLRLTPDVEEKIYRSSVYDTYEQILKDLNLAMSLLPLRSNSINLPGKLACYAMLSRVQLSMRDYQNAKLNADLYIQESPELIDYNTIDSEANPSFPTKNLESVFYAYYSGSIPRSSTTIDSNLISSYASNDLRRIILFRTRPTGSINFKGSYEGQVGSTAYCGLATDEVYLNRAECLVRQNDVSGGLRDLNTLLLHRYKNGEFIPYEDLGKEEALELILSERRKELVFRSTRWTDLRRLNSEGYSSSIKRVIGGVTYILKPGDKRWVWLIPEEVIRLSGISQNER